MKRLAAVIALSAALVAPAAHADEDQCQTVSQLLFAAAKFRTEQTPMQSTLAAVLVGAKRGGLQPQLLDLITFAVKAIYTDPAYQFQTAEEIGGQGYGACVRMIRPGAL